MSVDRSQDRRVDAGEGALAALTLRQGLFAGLTRKGLTLVALLALPHALRRTIYDLFGSPLTDWLLQVASAYATGLIALLLVTVTVVAIYNRVSSAPRRRYPALALGRSEERRVGKECGSAGREGD